MGCFFVLATVPVAALTGWTHHKHKKAAWRWVGTVVGMGISQYLIVHAYYFHPSHTLMLWSLRPLRLMAGWAGIGDVDGLSRYWALGFLADQVVWGTGIFLALAFFAELMELSVAQVPFFGRWHMPQWILWITIADLAIVAFGGHVVPKFMMNGLVVAFVGYLVMGINVLWRVGELAGLSKGYRIGLLGLWSLGSWVAVVLLILIGLYDSI